MAEQEHKHHHGNMDIETQERTFEGFVKAVGYGAVAIIVLLIFLGLVGG